MAAMAAMAMRDETGDRKVSGSTARRSRSKLEGNQVKTVKSVIEASARPVRLSREGYGIICRLPMGAMGAMEAPGELVVGAAILASITLTWRNSVRSVSMPMAAVVGAVGTVGAAPLDVAVTIAGGTCKFAMTATVKQSITAVAMVSPVAMAATGGRVNLALWGSYG